MSIEPSTLAERAFEGIYQMIMSGELPLGGEVNEMALSMHFSISRGPIREAVQRLQGLRLVTCEPYMRARVVSLSTQDLVEIFQLREAVEGMACRLAAAHMDVTEIDALIGRLETQRPGSASRRARAARPLDLHSAIAAGCGNARIRQLLCEELHHLLRLYRRRSGDRPGRRDRAYEEHWQILRALRARDGVLAESLMRAHIARATETLLREASATAVAGD